MAKEGAMSQSAPMGEFMGVYHGSPITPDLPPPLQPFVARAARATLG